VGSGLRGKRIGAEEVVRRRALKKFETSMVSVGTRVGNFCILHLIGFDSIPQAAILCKSTLFLGGGDGVGDIVVDFGEVGTKSRFMFTAAWGCAS
jgi:hypothetical protein